MKKAASYSLSRKLLLMLLFVISCSTHAVAQTFYYYDDYTGKKTTITLNEDKLCVSVYSDYKDISERIRANVQALFWTQDNIFDFIFITRSDYEKLASQDFWEEDAKSVIITPSYYRDDDRGEFYREIFATPYVCIKLKKEEDIDLLTPYLEKYKLKITSHSPYMPLYPILSLTLDSGIGPLECANEMFESGDFAESCPGWAFAGSGEYDPNTIRSITVSKVGASSEVYDLQGRRMAEGKPLHPGIYVKDGRKFVVK